jgi:cytochrome c-type biogenesis protein CcmH/NrfG
MRNPKKNEGYVKKQNMIIIVVLALVIGFVSGVAYTSFQSVADKRADLGVSGQQSVPLPPPGKGQTDRIQALEKETAQHPQNVEAWIQLGNTYFDTNRSKKAIMAYQKALELGSKNPNVWTDLGVMFRRNGEPLKALEAFDRAATIDPLHEICRLNKGIVLLHDLNDPEAAAQAWEELLEVNPLATAPGGQPVAELVKSLKSAEGEK